MGNASVPLPSRCCRSSRLEATDSQCLSWNRSFSPETTLLISLPPGERRAPFPKERGHRFAEVGCGSPPDGRPALVELYLNSSPMAGLVPYFRSGIVAASEQYGPGSMGGSNAAPLNPSKPGFPFWLLPFRSNAVLPPTPSYGVRPRNTPYLPHPIRDRVGSGPAGNRGRHSKRVPTGPAPGRLASDWGADGDSICGTAEKRRPRPGGRRNGHSRWAAPSRDRPIDCRVGRAWTPRFTGRLRLHLERRLDFPCDFLKNSSSRCFSASVKPAESGSAGRERQIIFIRDTGMR